MIVCRHCKEEVSWSNLLDKWYCTDCHTDEVVEVVEEEE